METQPRTLRLHVHRPTDTILILVAGGFLWLNLRPTSLVPQDLLNLTPDDLDPVTRTLFSRGWPLSPYMGCPFHGMKWHPEEGFAGLALVLDALVALLALAALGYASEWWIQRQKMKAVGPA